METIQLEMEVNKNIACSYNGKDYILLCKGDKLQPSCIGQVNHAKNTTFGLAYDAVKQNLGSVFDALHRGPKTCNNIKTCASFVHYLKVVGSDGKEERKYCFDCFGKFNLKEMCNEGIFSICRLISNNGAKRRGGELENITVDEVASEVKEGNIMLHREMSVIFSSGASNNERQKIIPFPVDVCIFTRSSDKYSSPHVPNEEQRGSLDN